MHGHTRKALAVVLAVGLLASVGLGGCAPKTTGGETGGTSNEPTKGGTMSFYIGEPAYIDPYNTQESEGTQVEAAVFDSLTAFDDLDPTKLLPAAAESWEPNADATVWTFKLNPNGKFSDGTPVKASDFVYAWNRIANPNTINTATGKADPSIISYHLAFVKGFDDVAAGKAKELEGVKAVDDLTLEVTLKQPFADFEYVVGHPALAPVPQKFVEQGVPTGSGETTVAFGEMPIGNGPFKLSEPWSHNQFIKVVQNENFSGTKPNLDGVDFKIFKDPETAYTEFEAGTLDFTQIGEGKIDDAKAKYGESENGYTSNPGKAVLLGAENSTYYFIFNMKKKPFDDPNVRKAISLGINRQAICDTVFAGTRDPADNILPPGIAGYEKGAWADSKYDLEAAKKALADAGYPEGKGFPKVKLGFNSGGGHEKIMELVAADLKAMGIESEFQSADFPVYLQQLDAGDFQVARLGWIADYPIAYNFLFALFETNSGDNKSKYSDPAVDQGIRDAEKLTDGDARVAKYQEINKTIGAANPVAPVMFYKHHHVGSDRLHDFTFGPMYLGNFEKAWISEGAAK